MKFKMLLVSVFAALTIAVIAAPVSKPAKMGAYYSSNGSGNDGTWLAMAGSGGTGTPVGRVAHAGMYYSSDGTGNDGTWLPCGLNCFGGGGSFTAAGDLSGSNTSQTVIGINGVLLSGLSTGLLKNTTATGLPSIAAAGTDYLVPGGALGTPTSGVITNLTGTCAACTANNSNQLGGLSATGAGAAIPTGPSSGVTVTGLVCYATSTGRQVDCGTSGIAQILSLAAAASLGVTSQLNNASGSASFTLANGNSAASSFVAYQAAAVSQWRNGLLGSTNYAIRDQITNNRVVDFPVNTMPANSVTGDANGANLGGIHGVVTIYSAAGTALPTCNTAAKGKDGVVSDATLPTYLGTYTSGGAIVAPVFCNGTAWVTH